LASAGNVRPVFSLTFGPSQQHLTRLILAKFARGHRRRTELPPSICRYRVGLFVDELTLKFEGELF